VMIVRTVVKFRPHESLEALSKEVDPQGACRVLEGQARQFAAIILEAAEELDRWSAR